jgi:hypothetical protein
MKSIADYFTNLDPHTSVLYASVFAFLIGFAKKVNGVQKDNAASNTEFNFVKYLKIEWLVIFANIIVIFLVQLAVDASIRSWGFHATWVGAATLSYAGNDFVVELLGKSRKFGREIVNQKTNALEGPGVKTPMPTKLEEAKNVTQ